MTLRGVGNQTLQFMMLFDEDAYENTFLKDMIGWQEKQDIFI